MKDPVATTSCPYFISLRVCVFFSFFRFPLRDVMVDLIKYLGMNKFNGFFFLINPIFKLAMPTFIINSLRLNVQTEYNVYNSCSELPNYVNDKIKKNCYTNLC